MNLSDFAGKGVGTGLKLVQVFDISGTWVAIKRIHPVFRRSGRGQLRGAGNPNCGSRLKKVSDWGNRKPIPAPNGSC
jgi:hypothetical protein